MNREPVVGDVLVVTKSFGSHGRSVGDKIVITRVDDSDDTMQVTSSPFHDPSRIAVFCPFEHGKGSVFRTGEKPWTDERIAFAVRQEDAGSGC